ncbi:MAG TPA: glucosamine-6-phosphate deaminase [Terriglobales bacterium]|jgi:glucosamine-6-phosphate deaminase|nr:glucosamine-6-phosphate deaminase [Terriglobales bacterium]
MIKCFDDKKEMARVAADQAAFILRDTIQKQGKARLIAATGAAQFEFLEALTTLPAIDWKRVEMFHLDEYIGLPETHPASFCRFLKERLIQKTGMVHYHLLNGDEDPAEVIRRTGEALQSEPIDVAFVGIGENGHLAFNDPPADFETEEPYIIVTLDEPCRRQQLGEGWFDSLADVPRRAISMSVRQILKTKQILCIVPDARKANAVKACFDGEISPLAPASILRTHPNTTVYLDKNSAALLRPATLAPAS